MLTVDELRELRGIANEPTIDQFVRHVGGAKVSDVYPNPAFENADYLFAAQRVLIELKILETEFGKTEQFRTKMDVLNFRVQRRWGKSPLSFDPHLAREYLKGFIELFCAPLARITKKANRQLRNTKGELDLDDHQGILLLVNDGFRELPPRLVVATLARILQGSCSSVDAVVYVTNHYVDIPGDDYARLLWVPLYSDHARDELVEFVDWLGGEWITYGKAAGLPTDDVVIGTDLNIQGARAIGTTFPFPVA